MENLCLPELYCMNHKCAFKPSPFKLMKERMMNNKIKLYYIFCIFLILIIGIGCTKTPEFTKLTGIWKYEPSYTVHPGRILVVGKLINESHRIPFEDYVVSELKLKNLDAFASYKALPSLEKVVKEQVKIAARVMRVKSVLVTRVVSVDQKDVSDNMGDTSMHGTVMLGSYLAEPHVKTFINDRIETGLFDVESEKLVWEAKSTILNPDSGDEAIKDYSLAILNYLRRDNIIP